MTKASLGQLPPSSLMSFLHKKRQLSGVVVTDYDTKYNNKYYHSRFDTSANVDLDKVCQMSTVLARTLYKLAVDPSFENATSVAANLQVNCTLVSRISTHIHTQTYTTKT